MIVTARGFLRSRLSIRCSTRHRRIAEGIAPSPRSSLPPSVPSPEQEDLSRAAPRRSPLGAFTARSCSAAGLWGRPRGRRVPSLRGRVVGFQSRGLSAESSDRHDLRFGDRRGTLCGRGDPSLRTLRARRPGLDFSGVTRSRASRISRVFVIPKQTRRLTRAWRSGFPAPIRRPGKTAPNFISMGAARSSMRSVDAQATNRVCARRSRANSPAAPLSMARWICHRRRLSPI